MGRYETLNSNTKDLVNCLLPGIASNFEIEDVIEVIPEDIRMRKWDCERREHIKDAAEDDPRNWGVQLLKDLITISRLKQGNLAEFQADLRAQILPHEEKHPWVRLADIKEIKDRYEKPERAEEELDVQEEEASESDYDYQLEELVELEERPRKRGRRSNAENDSERFQARQVTNRGRKSKTKRLRRDPSVGWERPGRHNYPHPARSEESYDRSVSAVPVNADELDDMSVEELQAHLELAEAELRTARMRATLLGKRRRLGGPHDTPLLIQSAPAYDDDDAINE
ncbi:hypothetical protein BU24DRAFT_187617 [Aaosphaeria arxii CBS 175.79]|uniref:Uncharacterized protein n=1 Tax=Aaosphaeria arxii CBS 175.79 TaxID=1450172 RepID=A0A6A5XSN0_9PLEO|nr:uncharacterized protein BU24DRAFT_187617 [Aaosphaeria arxii CBS 175.79]KAF2015909.1 hypothetical protein BU24DRAFT_187617 [Aaosphaeria arxii CBS 175.79]